MNRCNQRCIVRIKTVAKISFIFLIFLSGCNSNQSDNKQLTSSLAPPIDENIITSIGDCKYSSINYYPNSFPAGVSIWYKCQLKEGRTSMVNSGGVKPLTNFPKLRKWLSQANLIHYDGPVTITKHGFRYVKVDEG